MHYLSLTRSLIIFSDSLALATRLRKPVSAIQASMFRVIVAGSIYATVVFSPVDLSAASIGGCKFDIATHRFQGDLPEQAKCLLRKVKPKGSGATIQPIPDWLNVHIGTPVAFTKLDLERYLTDNGIAATDVAGALSAGDAGRPDD